MSETEDTRRSGGRGIIAGLLVTFVLGLVAMGYIVTGTDFGRDMIAQRETQNTEAPKVQSLAQTQPATSPATLPPAAGDIAYRLAALEGRVASVESRSTGGSVSAPKAEALFLAIAARRRFERGVPLGALEQELTARFGLSEAAAVAALTAWSAKPVTLAQIRADFAALGTPTAQLGWWDRLTSNIGSLIVVRDHKDIATAPAHLVADAQQRLAHDDVAGTLDLMRKAPASALLSRWIASASRFVQAEQAVIKLEDRALDAGPAIPPPPVLTPQPLAPPAPVERPEVTLD